MVVLVLLVVYEGDVVAMDAIIVCCSHVRKSQVAFVH